MSGEWSKDSNEYKFMGDFFKFAKEFYVVEPENKEYWDSMVKTASALCEKYGNSEFVLNVVLGFINYTDAEMKKRKGTQNKAEISGQTSLLG